MGASYAFKRSVIKRPANSTTGPMSVQTDIMSRQATGQTSAMNRQRNGQASTTDGNEYYEWSSQ